MPGALNPSRASRVGKVESVVTSARQLPFGRPSALPVAPDDEVERSRGTDKDADGKEQPGSQPPVDQPADATPRDLPVSQETEKRRGDLRAPRCVAASVARCR